MNTPIYDKSITALLVVDPYNDFISGLPGRICGWPGSADVDDVASGMR